MNSIALDANHSSLQKVQSTVIKVTDIRCAACVAKIEQALKAFPDIVRVRTNLPTKTVVVDYQNITANDVNDCINKLGFTTVNHADFDEQAALKMEGRAMLSRLGVAGVGMMQVMMYALTVYVAGEGGIEPAYEQLMRWASMAMAIPVAFYSAAPFHQGAIRDLKRLSLGMDVPVSLAIMAAFFFSAYNVLNQSHEVYFDSVCMFTFLLLIGRFIELSSRKQYQEGIILSESCLPKTATLIDGREVAVESLCPGDQVLVAAGEVIPGDGIVIEGKSSVSEMAFTGESMPLTKGVASRVLGGSNNIEADLVVEINVAFDEFVIRKMSDLYRESTLYKPEFSILADRIAQYFVAVIITLATIAGLGWYLAGADDWFAIALTVLVVSCPCALSLATPVAYTVAVSALKRFGVVVSTGEFLEKLSQVDHLVFDKTGTLTEGKLVINQVLRVTPVDAQTQDDSLKSDEDVLAICTALERCSVHPIARAFKTGVVINVEKAISHTGEGVEGVINGQTYRLGKPNFSQAISDIKYNQLVAPSRDGTWLLLVGKAPIAWINLSDEIRSEAAATIARLKAVMPVTLLTGDGQIEAERVASALKIDDLLAAATPELKVQKVLALQAEGRHLMMIGDGVNDAAAMGAAHTSLAVSPVDIVVQEAAEATLVQDDISKLIPVLLFAQRARAIIRQNITWAVVYNLSVIPLAISGILLPWMAALGMSVSSLLVVLNANRLAKVKE